ncbi:GyrI-like domain-containing protein [Bdellovibrio bacteriovorus]|uniref:GyrI-like domain-containing protein n=1 Tax=Bdellovibrio bacteriovorus TaxID=959 RepID=UPI0035A59A52
MSHSFTAKPDIKIVGISVRTSNGDEMKGSGRIGSQWQRFFSEGVMQRIPNQIAGGPIYAIYTDYESDVNGEYSFILGKEVSSFDNLPDDLIAKVLPASRYAAFTSQQGPMPNVVIDLWQHIWGLTPSDLGAERAYKADFEVYDQRSADPQNCQVDVFLSVR